MKRNKLLSLLLITLIGASVVFYSCNWVKAANPRVDDVVNGIAPVDNSHDTKWVAEFLTKLKKISPQERKEQMDLHAPRVTKSVIDRIVDHGYKCTDSMIIRYYFASGTAKDVKSGDGLLYDGGFNMELFFVVKGPCIKDSINGFVKCFNGWTVLMIDGEEEYMGEYSSMFTVSPGKGINYYIRDYDEAVDFADKFDLPLFLGEKYTGTNRISVKKAREIRNAKVLDYTGDKGSYNGSFFEPASKKKH